MPHHPFLLAIRAALISALIFAASAPAVKAQIFVPKEDEKIAMSTDSIRNDFRRQPYFGVYKDNYFAFGTSVGPKPTKHNTNIKFQISIAQRLTKDLLPWDTYLYLFYTQKAFWNVCESSMPMHDLNFNPGIGLTKPIFIHDKYIGKVTLQAEHESNGRDGDASRSWNRISLSSNVLLDPNFMVHGKFWIPIIDGENNKDILHYVGIFQVGMEWLNNDRTWEAGVIIAKRSGWNLSANVTLEAGWRISKRSNQYLYVQYYNGFGEGLLDYKRFHSELRVGMVIKPRFFSDY